MVSVCGARDEANQYHHLTECIVIGILRPMGNFVLYLGGGPDGCFDTAERAVKAARLLVCIPSLRHGS